MVKKFDRHLYINKKMVMKEIWISNTYSNAELFGIVKNAIFIYFLYNWSFHDQILRIRKILSENVSPIHISDGITKLLEKYQKYHVSGLLYLSLKCAWTHIFHFKYLRYFRFIKWFIKLKYKWWIIYESRSIISLNKYQIISPSN